MEDAMGKTTRSSIRQLFDSTCSPSFGLSVDYSWIVTLETQLTNTIIASSREEGAYLSATMRRGALIFFVVDNSDFNEDTPGVDPNPSESVTPSSGEIKHHNIPTRTVYNSLLASEKSLTEVNTLPVLGHDVASGSSASTPASNSNWMCLEDRGRSTSTYHNNGSSSSSIYYALGPIVLGCLRISEMCTCGTDEEECDILSQERLMRIDDDKDDVDPSI
ncbi:hypothetical protein LSH36_271g04007 [Paralvinella palmiformis]|uniref:Uncharacterized protein n=1 Tax=Paralvinella palmiformis TaxID=53620 RepID=A0AAD9N2I1_9ANNE|nr:hypothetical protein LSH36_271g04007 [Paralvinella palmiformis]